MCHGLQINCLSEIWLNDICLYHRIFPNCLTTFRSDTANSNKSSVAVLTTVLSAVGIFKRLYVLQLYDEWFGSKFTPIEAAVYPLVITIPHPPILNHMLFINIFGRWRKIFDTKSHCSVIGHLIVCYFVWLSGLTYQTVVFF